MSASEIRLWTVSSRVRPTGILASGRRRQSSLGIFLGELDHSLLSSQSLTCYAGSNPPSRCLEQHPGGNSQFGPLLAPDRKPIPVSSTRQCCNPVIQILRAVSNQWPNFDVLWPFSPQTPPPQACETYLERVGNLNLCKKLVHATSFSPKLLQLVRQPKLFLKFGQTASVAATISRPPCSLLSCGLRIRYVATHSRESVAESISPLIPGG
jgi:hypothetical protein